jgi:DNA repair exonuclease SbcCD nuclease subunit
MRPTIRVGDPHAQVSDLDEMARLIGFVRSKAKEAGAEKIEFYGDLFHTHNVVRLEVQDFWDKALRALAKEFRVVVLVGNHDQPGDGQREWTLNALKFLDGVPNLTVVTSYAMDMDTFYIAHTSNEEKFKEAVARGLSLGATRLACHQTFQGAHYENGMYAPDGFDPSIVSGFKEVISGHIHKSQRFANIFYLGTPRWLTLSDANEPKGIYVGPEFVSTESVCEPIRLITLTEGSDTPIPVGKRVFVELVGHSKWISAKAKELKGSVRVVPRPTDSGSSRLGRTETVVDLYEFLSLQKMAPGVNAKQVIEFIKEL